MRPQGVMSWALTATFFGCGAWHAWRTGYAHAGVLLSLIAATIGGYLGMAGTLVCLAMSHGPATMAAIEGSGGLFEGFPGVPLQLVIVAAIRSRTGTPGNPSNSPPLPSIAAIVSGPWEMARQTSVPAMPR